MRTPFTRRRFLRSTGGGLAALGLSLYPGCGPREPASPPESVETVSPEPDEYAPFQMGFQSYSLRQYKLPPHFAAQSKKLGLRYVELYNGHLPTSATPEQVKAIREGLLGIGLTVNAFGVERYTSDQKLNRALFEFGKNLGVGVLTADPMKDALDGLEALVAEYNIRIAIHNHGPEDERWRRPEWILEAVRERDARLGACVDVGHYIRAEVDPVEAIRLLADRVHGVHLKDFDADHQDVVLGEGLLDLKATLEALRDIGFNGPLSLEFEGERPVSSMIESLARIRDILAQF